MMIPKDMYSHNADPDSLEDSPKNLVLFVCLLGRFVVNRLGIDEIPVIAERSITDVAFLLGVGSDKS
jgi:hypothetical protein